MSLIERIASLEFPVNEADTNLISEIAYNVLFGVVQLTEPERAFLKRNKTKLRVLSSKAHWKRRLNVLTQPLFEILKVVAIRYLDG